VLVSLDGVAPSRMVGVSASVNLPLHHKVQKFSSGTGSPGWSRKKGHKMVVVVGGRCSKISFKGQSCFLVLVHHRLSSVLTCRLKAYGVELSCLTCNAYVISGLINKVGGLA